MKKITFVCILSFLGISVFALECPKTKLNCQFLTLNSNGNFSLESSSSATFKGVNYEEPSDEANECVASLTFKSKNPLQFIQVVAKDDLRTYMYVGVPYSALSPQFEFVASLNKEFSLSNGNEKVVCEYLK